MHRSGAHSRLQRSRRTLLAAALLASLFVSTSGALLAPASPSTTGAGLPDRAGVGLGAGLARAPGDPTGVVSVVPEASTPAMEDGAVLDIAVVGAVAVAVGTFSQVTSADGGPTVERDSAVAFDATTGRVLAGFHPVFDGAVDAVALAGDGASVFLAGDFDEVDGLAAGNVVRLDIATGRPTAGFSPVRTNGAVRTMLRHNGRLFIGGTFSDVNGTSRSRLASISSTTGALDDKLQVEITGNFAESVGSNPARGSVKDLAITGDAARMMVLGNFTQAGGLPRSQVAMIQLPPRRAAAVTGWSTARFDTACMEKFSSYVRAVQFSPDGSYFVIATSGGYAAGQLCDTVSRWSSSARGEALEPTWVAHTGSDTLLSLEVTADVVYVGGHQRWFNNPLARRKGRGAVPRPGLAALSPLNGVPLAWNPGRNPRGVGTTALLVTDAGLWVGSDTDKIGSPKEQTYIRKKLALFPWSGGAEFGPEQTGTLPGDVHLVGPLAAGSTATVRTRRFTGTEAGITQDAPFRLPGARTTVRGAFMVDGTLFYGRSDQTFWRRPMDDDGLGTADRIDPYRDPAWTGVRDGAAGLYDGIPPDFYAQLPSVTGMFYTPGRLYYTRSDSSGLHWRPFSVDSGIVGPVEQTVRSGVDFGSAAGIFLAPRSLYFVDRTSTRLHRVGFVGGRPRGSATVLTGAGRGWAARGLVLLVQP